MKLCDGVATGTIVNDDTGVLMLDTEVVEGDPGETTQMEFTVQMYPPLSGRQTAMMNWRIKNESIDNESTDIEPAKIAVIGEDYMIGSDNQISFNSDQRIRKNCD